MANNIVETIQKNLGFPPLQKIDPNLQEKQKKKRFVEPRKSWPGLQSPPLFKRLCRYRSKEGVQSIFSNAERTTGLNIKGKEKELEPRYAGVSENEAEGAMENIADEAVTTIKSSGHRRPTPDTCQNIYE